SNVESKEDILNDNDSEISRAPFMDDDYEEDISPEQLDDLMAFSHEMAEDDDNAFEEKDTDEDI
ncbi:MAG: hypothetical protein K6B41_01900, partial [Butyrivibrio sp.]|nr:hypothetical protein [Butyrivibrio sp.]